MATGGGPSSLADMVECDICMEVMARPQALNCLHHVCKACCDKLHRVGEEGVIGVSCPSCRHFTPESNIKDSFILNKLLDIYSRKQTTKEQTSKEAKHCMQCDQPDVSYLCTECHIELCKLCNDRHLRIPMCKDHKIVSIDEISSDRNKPLSIMKYCSKHPGYPIKYNCVPYNISICADCKIQDHDIHKTESVETALEKMLIQTKAHINTIYRHKSAAEGKLNQVRKLKEECQSNCDTTKSRIQQHTEIVIAKIRANSEDLIEDVEGKNQATKKELQLLESDLENQVASHESLLSWSDTIVKITEGPGVLCELQDGLFKRIETCAKESPFSEPEEVKMPQVQFSPNKVVAETNGVGKLQTKYQSVSLHIPTGTTQRSLVPKKNFTSFRTTEIDLTTLTNKPFTKMASFKLKKKCLRMCYHSGKFWLPCFKENCISVYNTSMELVDTICHEQVIRPRSLHWLNDHNIIVASENGLFQLNIHSNITRKLKTGLYLDVHLNNSLIVAVAMVVDSCNIVHLLKNTDPPTVQGQFEVTNTGHGNYTKCCVMASDQHIFVCFNLSKESYIVKYSHSGKPLGKYGERGSERPGQINLPFLCATGAKNAVLIADNENRRLQVLDEQGHWSILQKWKADMFPVDVVFVSDAVMWVLFYNKAEDRHYIQKYLFKKKRKYFNYNDWQNIELF